MATWSKSRIAFLLLGVALVALGCWFLVSSL